MEKTRRGTVYWSEVRVHWMRTVDHPLGNIRGVIDWNIKRVVPAWEQLYVSGAKCSVFLLLSWTI